MTFTPAFTREMLSPIAKEICDDWFVANDIGISAKYRGTLEAMIVDRFIPIKKELLRCYEVIEQLEREKNKIILDEPPTVVIDGKLR